MKVNPGGVVGEEGGEACVGVASSPILSLFLRRFLSVMALGSQEFIRYRGKDMPRAEALRLIRP